MKVPAFKHFNKKKTANEYSQMYNSKRSHYKYPINKFRLEIIKKLLLKHNPKKIVDAGCGSGMPLIQIKKMGFNIIGYDKSLEMVNKAKKNLKAKNLSEKLVSLGDFEKPNNLKNNSFDCILGMGTFYYSKNLFKTLKKQKEKMKKKGRIIFSLRNELFDMSTFNDYSVRFYKNFYNVNQYNNKINQSFNKIFSNFNKRRNVKKNIDDQKVFSNVNNPLTIKDEIYNKVGLKCEGLYFYHFHSLPPIYEKKFPKIFYKESLKLEKAESWKGYFLASGFVLDCVK